MTEMQYGKWKIEVVTQPTEVGFGQLTITVSFSDGVSDIDTKFTPSGDQFPTKQAAVEDGVRRAKQWIDSRG